MISVACLICLVSFGQISEKTAPARAPFTTATYDHEFEDEIEAFEAQDQQSPPAPGGIVFSGSSSIRLWDVPRYFPGSDILNRGFGGSTIADLLYFENRALLNYKPRLVVFYSGENDIVFGRSADDVFSDFKTLYADLTKVVPNVRLVVIGLKPSPGRQESWPAFRAWNASVAAFLKDKPNTTFVDLYDRFLGPNGEAQTQYFQDEMHLNDAGYQIWVDAIRPYVH